MKTEIQIFENAEFGQIRTMVMPDGQVGFVGKDVCDVLGYSKARNAIAMHVEEDDALKWGLTDSLGRTQQTTFINESGLYSLILCSKLPKAREFKHWVTSEVLPQIRKTGEYSRKDAEVRQMMALMQKPETVMMMCKTMVSLDEQVKALLPKAEFAEAVMESEDTCTVAELAKLIYDQGVEIGQNRLFAWMRDHKYLGTSEHHWNVPQQKYIEAGLFKVKTSKPWYDEMGDAHYNVTPLVTGKGQEYFVRIFASGYASDLAHHGRGGNGGC